MFGRRWRGSWGSEGKEGRRKDMVTFEVAMLDWASWVFVRGILREVCFAIDWRCGVEETVTSGAYMSIFCRVPSLGSLSLLRDACILSMAEKQGEGLDVRVLTYKCV